MESRSKHLVVRTINFNVLLLSLFLVGIGRAWQAQGQTYQELHAFTRCDGDGGVPQGPLLQAKDGNFYGTTFYGGDYGYGTIFKLTAEGVLMTLASFDATNNDQHPITGLTEATNGDFYGATVFPSRIFRMSPDGVVTIFAYMSATVIGQILQANDGYLYFVSSYGDGEISRMRPEGGVREILYRFDHNAHPENGYHPSAGLMQARDGNLYGTTTVGGGDGNGCGTVYKLTTNGTLVTIAVFGNEVGSVHSPYGRMLEASDGNFYGYAGALYDAIFKMTPSGTLTEFAHLDGSNGESPAGDLIEGKDGNFYGAARYYGPLPFNEGTVFRATPDGVITALISFTGFSGAYPGATPYAGLIQGRDGNLYGTSGTEGTGGSGTVFRIIMPGPRLNSERFGEQMVLSWRTNYTGFKLQSTSELSSANWIDYTNSPAVVGPRFTVTNSIAGERRFYRLKK